MVYILEAHPDDGWQVPNNITDGVIYNLPTTYEGREDIARDFLADKGLTMPCLMDRMDDAVNVAYDAWPNRVVLIDIDGTTYFLGQTGPGVGMDELEAAMAKLFPAG